MKVKALRGFKPTNRGAVAFGEEFEVDDKLAKNWINAGLVKSINPVIEKVKEVIKEAPKKETATSKTKTRKAVKK